MPLKIAQCEHCDDNRIKDFAKAEALLAEDFEKAVARYISLTTLYPQEERSWFGLTRAVTHNGTATLLDKSGTDLAASSWRKAKELGASNAVYDKCIETLKANLFSKQLELKAEYESLCITYDYAANNRKLMLVGGLFVFTFGAILAFLVMRVSILLGILCVMLAITGLVVGAMNANHDSGRAGELQKEIRHCMEECTKYGVFIPFDKLKEESSCL